MQSGGISSHDPQQSLSSVLCVGTLLTLCWCPQLPLLTLTSGGLHSSFYT